MILAAGYTESWSNWKRTLATIYEIFFGNWMREEKRENNPTLEKVLDMLKQV